MNARVGRTLSLFLFLIVLLASCTQSGDDSERNAGDVAPAGRLSKKTELEDRIANLIQEGADVNEIRDRDIAILYWAVEFSDVGATKLLLENGADPDTRPVERSQETALFATATSLTYGNDEFESQKIAKSKAIAELLLQHGANVNHSTRLGETPLYKAALRGRTDLCELFIQNGAEVNSADALGTTPLHGAVKEGYWESAQLLIGHGAEPNAQDKLGETSLSLANKRSEESLNQDIRNEGLDYNPGSDYDRTIEVLIEHGAQ